MVDPNFDRKLASITSLQELDGFKQALIDYHGSLQQHEQEAIARKRVDLMK